MLHFRVMLVYYVDILIKGRSRKMYTIIYILKERTTDNEENNEMTSEPSLKKSKLSFLQQY